MVRATSDIVSSVSLQTARLRSTRDDPLSGSDSFSALLDSNTAATASSDRSQTAPPDLKAPAPRSDDSSGGNDRPRAGDDRADQTAADPPNTTTPAADRTPNAFRSPQATRSKAQAGSKSDVKMDSKTDAKDAAKDSDASASKDADAVPSAAQPVAVTAAAAAATAAPVVASGATTTSAGGQPMATAAALLKTQAAVADATPGETDKTPQAASTEAEQNFAALIGLATPAGGKTGVKQPGFASATATANTTSDGKADATAATPAQPVDGPAAQKPAKDAKPVETASAGGAKPDSTAASADGTKPVAALNREHRNDQQTEPATADIGTPATNNAVQPPVQSAPTAAATAPQLAATIATNAAVPLNGVAVEIAQSAKSGKSSFDIRLDPAELGRIDVRLEVDKHGNVTSHLTVEKPETLTMLRQDAPQLQRTLEQAGLKTSDGGLQFSLRDQSSGQQQQNNGNESGRQAHRLIVSEDTTLSSIPAGRGYGRMLGSSSGVDISI